MSEEQRIAIYAWKTSADLNSEEEPILVDSMTESQWSQLGQTPTEFASALLGGRVHKAVQKTL